MRNRHISHAHEQTKIYGHHYKPSFNLFRLTKSILGVLIFGQTMVAQGYVPLKKRLK